MNKIISQSLSYYGFCRACNKTHSLPSEKAIEVCCLLMQKFSAYEQIDYLNDEIDLRLSTKHLYNDIGGKMFGVLICEDVSGNEVILKAFSSTYNGIWNIEGWVPHLANETTFMQIVEKGNLEIHPLTDLINGLEKNSDECKLKVEERKSVSQKLHKQLFDLYEVTNFKNEKRSLADALIIKKGIPNGTGDCCAPKLLNYAAIHKLKPISIAEFYWGKTSPSGDKIEGEFYSSCTEKCLPLLGFMMCGIKIS
ncbi:MAG: hypothetical protein JNJ41_10040 [Bacteroidia bacterium]|nr:hypothetical protein [Bacteroidia bacterium]